MFNLTSSAGAEFGGFCALKVHLERRVVSSWARNEKAFVISELCTDRIAQIADFRLVLDIGTGSWSKVFYFHASFKLSSHRFPNILNNFRRNGVGLHANNYSLVYSLEFCSHAK
jgi:hypothetical protein